MKRILIVIFLIAITVFVYGKDADDACTTITVGKLASVDGSVMTTHTCDSREDRTWIDIVPARAYKPGVMRKTFLKSHMTDSAYDLAKQKYIGDIPQVEKTYKYLNATLPPINEN